MKTTIELPDALLIAAKKRAIDTRTTLRELVARGLRRELEQPRHRKSRPIRWVSVPLGLPPELDLSSREKMWEWIESEK